MTRMELKWWLRFYNVVLIALSGYMFVEISRQVWILGYGVYCNLEVPGEAGVGVSLLGIARLTSFTFSIWGHSFEPQSI